MTLYGEKENPHIKVSGKRDHVVNAKERIMNVLDTKSTRVTLKMDVSHTEHSHVIGKGGNNIKKVMQDTGCHIHFPDSNRNNQAEKSNQVSIAGQPLGVEQARTTIRELLPLVFMFEIPITVPIPDPTIGPIKHIQDTYNVTITFKQRQRQFVVAVIVRGSVNNVKNIKEATNRLIEHLTGTRGTTVLVSMQLEIAPQHHLFIIGRGGANIKQLMQQTGASIHFPDPNTVQPQRKGTVYITGTMDSVFMARNQLIGCLPLVLMFDMKDDTDMDQNQITQLMEQLDVFISIKPKPKQPSKSVIVKSIERNAPSLYEARRRLLGVSTQAPPGFTPRSQSEGSANNPLNSLTMGMVSPNMLNVNTNPLFMLNGGQSPNPTSPVHSPSAPPIVNPGCMFSSMVLFPTLPQGYPTLQPHFGVGVVNPSQNGVSVPEAKDLNHNSSLLQKLQQQLQESVIRPNSQMTSITQSSASSPSHSPPNTSSIDLISAAANKTSHFPVSTAGLTSPFPASTSSMASSFPVSSASRTSPFPLSSDSVTSPFPVSNANMTSQLTSQEPITTVNFSSLQSMQKLMDAMAPITTETPSLFTPSTRSAGGSPMGSSSPLTNHGGSPLSTGTPGSPMCRRRGSGLMDEQPLRNMPFQNGERGGSGQSSAHASGRESPDQMGLAPGSNRPQPGQMGLGSLFPSGSSLFDATDYEQKKLLANRAIQKKPEGECRIPTDIWSGFGFSKSMPDSQIRERLQNKKIIRPPMTTMHEETPGSDVTPPNNEVDPWGPERGHGDGSPGNSFNMSGGSQLISAAPGGYPSPRKKGIEYHPGISNHMGSTSPIPPSPPHPHTEHEWIQATDLAELFSTMGLSKYTDLFIQQEIDLGTFLTMTDQDLKELGITTFGARRKMLIKIEDLNKQTKVGGSISGHTGPPNNPFMSASGAHTFNRRHDIASQSGRW